MKIKQLFFDLDHTLWDFETNSKDCIVEIFEHFKTDIPEHIKSDVFFEKFSVLNQEMWRQLDLNQISHEYLRKTRFKFVFAKFNHIISYEKSLEINNLFLKLLPSKGKLMEGCLDVLNELSAKYELHIVSNGYLDIQTEKMQSGGILHFFNHLITFDVANSRKPESAIFEYAVNKCGAHIDEVVMIGDNEVADIDGAQNAGLKAIHYDETGNSVQKYICNKLSDLPKLLLEFEK